MRDVNKKFQAEGRKVALIIVNCPVNPVIEDLSHVKLAFLPPNTTSVSQPMDQGVIRCLKAHYRKWLVKLILCSLDSNKPLPKVSLLTALQLLVLVWNEVSQTTIVNCFKRAKIWEKDQTIAINDEDGAFKEINENMKELRGKKPSLVPENMTAKDFPSTRNVEHSLEILKNLSLFSEKRGDQMQDLINKFETLLTRDNVEKCKQVKLRVIL